MVLALRIAPNDHHRARITDREVEEKRRLFQRVRAACHDDAAELPCRVLKRSLMRRESCSHC